MRCARCRSREAGSTRPRCAPRSPPTARAAPLPALLVGSAGTVNTGAIDPLDALADVAAAEGLWFHVDGAYGAFGVLDPAIAARYRGMERADSLALDPHKWLGVPVDAGCALVRRADDLRDAFSLIPPYLRQDADAAVGTFAEYGLEQTRPFRALKTWATIAARGRAGIAAQVARANALARELATLVEREPELELAAAPETSIVAFRARPAGCPPDRLDERQPRAARGGSGARPRLRHRHRLRRPRDAARLHPAPGHELGAPRDARRRSRRDRPRTRSRRSLIRREPVSGARGSGSRSGSRRPTPVRWLPCAGMPPASLSIRARCSRFQVMNVVLRLVKSFSGPPEPGVEVARARARPRRSSPASACGGIV